jgi:hypothetical protein
MERDGMSDMHGSEPDWRVAARVAESESGDERMNGANGMSDPAAAGLRGKQRASVGQRASFNCADRSTALGCDFGKGNAE